MKKPSSSTLVDFIEHIAIIRANQYEICIPTAKLICLMKKPSSSTLVDCIEHIAIIRANQYEICIPTAKTVGFIIKRPCYSRFKATVFYYMVIYNQ